MPGPLQGVRIIEMSGIGPGPFCGMMLADQGADVICVERLNGGSYFSENDILSRSRRSIALDLKCAPAVKIVRNLCRSADGLIEGYRPGVMERFGLGPATLLADNPRLVFGRMTGWGQSGPLAQQAGHDINYLALAGALHSLGRAGEKPTPPINLLGDFGGGGMLLAFGMVAALLHARASGKGQVVDCAMIDGAALMMSMVLKFIADGRWREQRGCNFLDTGAHYYETYETSDAKFLAVGAIEPPFYAALFEKLGLLPKFVAIDREDPQTWAMMKDHLARVFKTKTRDEWTRVFEDCDACCTPVLTLAEAALHRHNIDRGTFAMIDGRLQPSPAPRFSETPPDRPRARPAPGSDSISILTELGYDPSEIALWRAEGVVG